jgi:hypothetical protein
MDEALKTGKPLAAMLFKWDPYKSILDRYGREFRVNEYGSEIDQHNRHIAGKYRVKDKCGRSFMIDELGNEIDGSIPPPKK